MAYVVKTVVTKPANVAWFSKSGPAAKIAYANIVAWTHARPGFVSASEKALNANSVEDVLVFDTKANYDAFVAGRATQPDFVVQGQYFTANKITSVETVL